MDIRISKKELCRIFGLFKGSRPRYTVLHKDYFTDEVLERLKITRDEYKKIKTFDAVTSLSIYEIFKIEESEKEEL